MFKRRWLISINYSQEKVTIQKRFIQMLVSQYKSYGMINEGDKIMFGVSSVKDSLTLINIFIDIKGRSKVKFTIACSDDSQSPDYDPTCFQVPVPLSRIKLL
ncbi:hypothetical protein DICPUDRAFT_157981 [Dictyostelium purpureum]|uniref:Uncharacterized protein n=1 Tax=Dictyostelium purpureum TaxID=5786 RepID=F1A0I2_DICPU|nr:uncharacterized protein DICPUDRAFT_157981 [Dictyostelium purpureum]EGC30300.1 hypothetical protein DICPUDRAFT_157981 [Dictyostelium purpureum]|eukprot:XP_003293179.1 hypothetical protein DICPUDRAFT_157981 [Dictyostelium purpureum]